MTSWVFPTSTGLRCAADVLSITLEMSDASTVVSLDGPVCAYSAPHLDAELTQIEHVDRHRLIIDASRVRTMTTDGVDVLTEHARRCTDAGGDLVLRNPTRVIRRVLAVLDMSWLLESTRRLPTA